MYPYYSNVVLSTNKYDDPVITVTIGRLSNGSVVSDGKPLFRKSTYTVSAMLTQLRASRRKLSSYLVDEQTKVCRPAGETDSLDDVIERLLCLGFMIEQCGTPFVPSSFLARFGGLPYLADQRALALVKEFLLK